MWEPATDITSGYPAGRVGHVTHLAWLPRDTLPTLAEANKIYNSNFSKSLPIG